jgi:hypothetical protein
VSAPFVTRAVVAAGALLAVEGCAKSAGLDDPARGQPQADASNVPEPDGSSDARDSSTNADGNSTDGAAVDSPADQVGTDAVIDAANPPCQTPPGVCLGTLPVGWNLIVFRSNRDAACPENFAQADVIADTVAGAGACDCSCTVGSAPSCTTTGQMSTRYSTTDGCASAGASINVSGTGCTPLAGNLSTYFSATPLPASLTCSASAVLDDTQVSSTPARTCQVPSECSEEVCNGAGPPGFSACVASDGDVPCPAGWNTRTVIGESATLSCSTCTCQASATCNGRINFYSDSGCNTLLIAFDANDTCQATNGGGNIAAFTYSATVSGAQCTADGPRTASVALAAPRTVCCK